MRAEVRQDLRGYARGKPSGVPLTASSSCPSASISSHSGWCWISRSQAYTPERIHFLGARSDVPRLLRDIDVLLLTSHSEGCPNLVLEALAVGTPVIAAPAGDTPLIIRAGENGSVIWSGRVEDYVVATESWLSRCRPRVPMGALFQELERTYGIDGMVAGTLAAWKLLCSRSVRVAREL